MEKVSSDFVWLGDNQHIKKSLTKSQMTIFLVFVQPTKSNQQYTTD